MAWMKNKCEGGGRLKREQGREDFGLRLSEVVALELLLTTR